MKLLIGALTSNYHFKRQPIIVLFSGKLLKKKQLLCRLSHCIIITKYFQVLFNNYPITGTVQPDCFTAGDFFILFETMDKLSGTTIEAKIKCISINLNTEQRCVPRPMIF